MGSAFPDPVPDLSRSDALNPKPYNPTALLQTPNTHTLSTAPLPEHPSNRKPKTLRTKLLVFDASAEDPKIIALNNYKAPKPPQLSTVYSLGFHMIPPSPAPWTMDPQPHTVELAFPRGPTSSPLKFQKHRIPNPNPTVVKRRNAKPNP